MTTRHLLPIALAGIITLGGGAAVAPAKSAGRPAFVLPSFLAPRTARPAPKATESKHAESKPSDPPPIAFFVATGPPDACGPGCNAWIAADGKIDLHAARRLRKLLARVGSRKLPLYLYSVGGSVLGALELGRLVRSHDLAVGVARTMPVACSQNPQDKSCEMLKRAGQDLASELDSSRAMCNSACVLVLAGGTRRSVPPWVRLGVHAIGVDRGKTPARGPAIAAATRSANARIVDYLRDMGIPKALFDASNAVPHETSRFLERDELVRFGLDTREFGETDWRFAEKPNLAIAKGFFVRTGDPDLAYPEALLRLNCGAGKAMRLTFARERPAFALGGALPVRVTVNGMSIDVPYATQVGRIEMYNTMLWPDTIASAGDDGALVVSGFSPRGSKAQGDVPLRMTGFSAAYGRLRRACGEAASAGNGCSAGELSPRCMPEALKTWHPSPAAAGGQAPWPPR